MANYTTTTVPSFNTITDLDMSGGRTLTWTKDPEPMQFKVAPAVGDWPTKMEWGNIGAMWNPARDCLEVYSTEHDRKCIFEERVIAGMKWEHMVTNCVTLGMAVLNYCPEELKDINKVAKSIRMLHEVPKEPYSWAISAESSLTIDYTQSNWVPKCLKTLMVFVASVPEGITFSGQVNAMKVMMPPWTCELFEELQPDLQKEIFGA